MDSTAALLLAHKQALFDELSETEERVVALKAEIESVKKALDAIGSLPPPPPRRAFNIIVPIARMSIKQLVIKALRDKFPDGATTNQLLEQFVAWGRTDVVKTSLSPQLSRLREEERIDREGLAWILVKRKTPAT